MRIDGAWRLCDDGIVRPVVRGEVRGAGDQWIKVLFLLDTGADRTVLSEDILSALRLQPGNATQILGGVGGSARSVTISTAIRMVRENGDAVLFTGEFAAFTDPAALDMSVLGRDITNLFAVIVDRPQDVVCMLGAKHRYMIVEQ